MLSDDAKREIEQMIEDILHAAIPDAIENWGMLGPHQIGATTYTGRCFIVTVTPIPGVFMVEEFDPAQINSLLN